MTVAATSVNVRSLRRLHIQAGEISFDLDVCQPTAYGYGSDRAAAHLTRTEDDFVRILNNQASLSRTAHTLEVAGVSFRDARSLFMNAYAANFSDGSLTRMLTYMPQSTTEALLSLTIHSQQGTAASRAGKRKRQATRVRQIPCAGTGSNATQPWSARFTCNTRTVAPWFFNVTRPCRARSSSKLRG